VILQFATKMYIFMMSVLLSDLTYQLFFVSSVVTYFNSVLYAIFGLVRFSDLPVETCSYLFNGPFHYR
jgi:hypothetical protein